MAEKIKNKKRIIIFMILVVFVGIGVFFSTSYSIFQKQMVVKNFTLKVDELKYALESTELSSGSITIPGGASKDVTIQITSQNPIHTKYELVYNASDVSNIEVGYYDDTASPVLGVIDTGESKTISLKIVNNGSTNQTVSFLVEGGFDYNELEISKGNRITKEFKRVIPITEKVFASDSLGDKCKIYNDGVDTFLVGQCSQNYVWYSGKLWRVVLKNNATGTVKMVTDNAMTTISYNASGNTAFENSYVDQWLQQEFLPTLHDYQDYLVSGNSWNASLNNTTTPSRPAETTKVSRTVGLLNSYEYYTTYNHSDGLATATTGYLNDGMAKWLLGAYSSTNIQAVNGVGNLWNINPALWYAVYPAVNLKPELQILEGTGTIDNPYRLAGEEKPVNGTTLLTTRYSGEYINFNSSLYRIVNIENNLTKITAVDKPSTLEQNVFHSSQGITNFGSVSLKTDLENYYQKLSSPYKSMVAGNQTWYLGASGDGTNYKTSICSVVSTSVSSKACSKVSTTATANVGLPRAGEIFTSIIARENQGDFWTLTPYDTGKTYIFYVSKAGAMEYTAGRTAIGARPSMYLKSTVKIASTNTGDGTYEHPYDIE